MSEGGGQLLEDVTLTKQNSMPFPFFFFTRTYEEYNRSLLRLTAPWRIQEHSLVQPHRAALPGGLTVLPLLGPGLSTGGHVAAVLLVQGGAEAVLLGPRAPSGSHQALHEGDAVWLQAHHLGIAVGDTEWGGTCTHTHSTFNPAHFNAVGLIKDDLSFKNIHNRVLHRDTSSDGGERSPEEGLEAGAGDRLGDVSEELQAQLAQEVVLLLQGQQQEVGTQTGGVKGHGYH